MATYQIGNRKTTFTPAEADSTYILGKDKLVETVLPGIQSVGLDGLSFEIAGKIRAMDDAISIGDELSPASTLSIEIAQTGRLLSDSRGINLQATGFEIDNHGRIKGANGIRVVGADGRIENDGAVIGSGAGIVASGQVAIRNEGTIRGDQYGIVFNATQDGSGSLRNAGTIEADQIAVMGSTGDDRCVNSGTVGGDISLRDGADLFLFRGGEVTGVVGGGKGDDRYVIHAEGATLAEMFNEGFDFVRASISFTLAANIEQLNLIGKGDIDGTGNAGDNHLQGNAGRNVLRGEGGVDFLVGLAGNDRLSGGEGGDVFNFQMGSGRDVVMDFEAGIDEIQLGGLKGAKGFDDMLANHVTDEGDDLWITYGKDVVVLKNTEVGDLLSGDFVFG